MQLFLNLSLQKMWKHYISIHFYLYGYIFSIFNLFIGLLMSCLAEWPVYSIRSSAVCLCTLLTFLSTLSSQYSSHQTGHTWRVLWNQSGRSVQSQQPNYTSLSRWAAVWMSTSCLSIQFQHIFNRKAKNNVVKKCSFLFSIFFSVCR